jgi:hypothetical protein
MRAAGTADARGVSGGRERWGGRTRAVGLVTPLVDARGGSEGLGFRRRTRAVGPADLRGGTRAGLAD